MRTAVGDRLRTYPITLRRARPGTTARRAARECSVRAKPKGPKYRNLVAHAIGGFLRLVALQDVPGTAAYEPTAEAHGKEQHHRLPLI